MPAYDLAKRTRPVVVIDHQPRWAEEYDQIETELRTLVGDVSLAIDHIGSTSVPDLGAKDVIDVQITIASLDASDEFCSRLVAGGLRQAGAFRYDSYFGMAEADPELRKLYFREREGARRVHLHVRERGRFNQRYALLFRDYLRASPAACLAYEMLKRRAAPRRAALSREHRRLSLCERPYVSPTLRGSIALGDSGRLAQRLRVRTDFPRAAGTCKVHTMRALSRFLGLALGAVLGAACAGSQPAAATSSGTPSAEPAPSASSAPSDPPLADSGSGFGSSGKEGFVSNDDEKPAPEEDPPRQTDASKDEPPPARPANGLVASVRFLDFFARGSLSPGIGKRIIAQHAARMRMCYEHGLSRNDKLQGAVFIKLEVDDVGRPTGVSATAKTTLADADVVKCVVEAQQGLSFPPSESGATTFEFGMVFEQVPPKPIENDMR